MSGKTLMLLPGTCCDWQSNFGSVIDDLKEKYHLICVNYDGFDGSNLIFPGMITVTEKIEKYITDYFGGHIDGAIGSSLGGTFVGQLIMREKVHVDHGIFGSSDLDQSGILADRVADTDKKIRVASFLRQPLLVKLLTVTGIDLAYKVSWLQNRGNIENT